MTGIQNIVLIGQEFSCFDAEREKVPKLSILIEGLEMAKWTRSKLQFKKVNVFV
jgi:hypothetical protein